jgi:solute carrier family 8 (sodium/calcium exchanger)
MALGSSAPEILLSIIEVCGNNFQAGELGPNTIVGSAAYNLFVIIGYCILVVPAGEIRRIKHLRVFFVTATWSVFAYIWLYLIISVISKNVIELWEAVLTFLFFPITVLSAYLADRNIYFMNFLEKKVRSVRFLNGDDKLNKQGIAPDDVAVNGQPLSLLQNDPECGVSAISDQQSLDVQFSQNPELKHFEEHRREYISILKELRQKNPDIGIDELQTMAEVEILKRGPKSRAYYRIQATRKLIGSANVKRKIAEKQSNLKSEKSKNSLNTITEDKVDNVIQVFFEPAHYTCFESVGNMSLFVSRVGGDASRTVLVDYRTENGSAQASSDYVHSEGTLVFYPGETKKEFSVNIIDDDVYEEDEHFYARIINVRYKDDDNKDNKYLPDPTLKITTPYIATVMILDDDHGGIFMMAEDKQEVVENCCTVQVKVLRTSGARGRVKVPFKTIDGTAIGGKDFEKRSDFVVFNNNETE